ncbi:NifB/NifX family molybdenum-iron cluster-binding protein [Desulfatitalea alkaliphila]|uniref:NifB/NifX family molybdenum-iron cluster-binding protein n=1 Tax=Desulfatitalea alkaliphila TaxID=2929485 RepID=A0AA41R5K4_9BACT|nr:NifB/NifX family molybdenum-iron cluster-binding protein [Desulfatitalea alkaliphila]MCJ8501843.1 NifB/NifX family molybdenum-iron cluster-binding protein [Desulfatitalea alkaliphila]
MPHKQRITDHGAILRHKRRRRQASRKSPTASVESVAAALPVFHGRVAPVLDTCTQLLILGPEPRRLPLACSGLADRAEALQTLGVQVVICGALSQQLAALLAEKKIRVICGIAGNVPAVVRAYQQNRLHLPCFHLPGFWKSEQGTM